jgi:hypothetical protein
MSPETHVTVGHLARQLGAPPWSVRRAVDALGEDIPRAGLYRLVPVVLVDRVREELRRMVERRARTAVG